MSKKKETYRIILNSPERLRLAQEALSRLDLSEAHVLEIKPFSRNRSLEQNAALHSWLGVIAEHMGVEPIELKEEFKQRWVVPILERDDEDFREQLQVYREMYQAGEKDKAQRLADLLRKRVSTTWLSVRQFTELLDQIDKFAEGLGIVLPKRENYEERY